MLKKYRILFEVLEKRNIRYVIWKSLEFWNEQLEGEGDVDIVFDPVQYDEVLAVMCDQHYVEDMGSPDRIGDKVKVFRCFDSDQLRHGTIHAHFDCWFGSKRYKEFVFPDTQELFNFAYRADGVLRISQGHFIVTRILMVALRQAYSDTYVCKLAAQYEMLDKQDRQIVDKYLTDYFQIAVGPLMRSLAKEDFSNLEVVRETALQLMEQQQPFSKVKAEVKRNNYPKSYLSYILYSLIGGKRNKLVYPMSIMFAGHDGAGKSTATRMVREKVAKMAMTKGIYLGRSAWALPNCWLNSLRQKGGAFRALNLIWPYTSTVEILIRLLVGKILVRFGFIVIYDRSTIDLMIKWKGSRKFGSWFPLWVSRLLSKKAEADLCYLLLTDFQTVMRRKARAGHSSEEISRLTEQYSEYAGVQFDVIDTTDLTPEALTGRVMNEVFQLAAQAQAR